MLVGPSGEVTIVLAADTALKIATRSMRSDNYPRASTETLRVPWRTPDMMHNNRALTRAWRRSALVRFPAYLTVIALACSEASKSSDDGDGAGGTGASSPGGTGGTSMSSGGVATGGRGGLGTGGLATGGLATGGATSGGATSGGAAGSDDALSTCTLMRS